ncbi:centromere protein K [Anabrus simplex]|uniref:centromere protein K n=1 Tax=Anabrus simplex TaxID=316456 RepID=UPI0035A39A52
MAFATSSQSSSVDTSSSAGSSDSADVQNIIRRKKTEYAQAFEELSSLVEDYPEYESVHERIESLVDHKVRMLMGLMEQVKLTDLAVSDNFHKDLDNVVGKTVNGLSQELRDLNECLKKNETEISKAEKDLDSIVKQMELLKTAAEKRKETKEMYTLEDLERKLRTAEREFRKHKTFMHDTINEIFPNEKELVLELLGALCDQLFQSEDGDNYITIDETKYYPIFELFLDGDIVKRHPYDKTKIKLAGF